jgi:hypothetical protein
VVVSPGWQTQVFLNRRPYGKTEKKARRADLTNASILMSLLGEGFLPDREDLRWTELARLGLSNNRCLAPVKDLESVFWSKTLNPVLGLFCAHLLLHADDLDLDTFKTIVAALEDQIDGHPDVNALMLRLYELGAGRRAPIPPYETPPMLRQSWEIVVESSVRRPDLVPATSLAEMISARLWGAGPWLVWQTPENFAGQMKDKRRAADLPQLSESIPELEDMLAENAMFQTRLDTSDLDEVEEGLLRYISHARPPSPEVKSMVFRGVEESYIEDDEAPLSDDSLIKALGVPNSAARKAAASLLRKLRARAAAGPDDEPGQK